LQAGDVFGYNVKFPLDEGEWEMTGAFELSVDSPDNMLVYCLNADEKPIFLSAVTTNGAFSEPGLDSYTANETALPENLAVDGNLALPFEPNYLYTGPREVTNREEMVAAFKDPINYAGRNTPYSIITSGAAGRVDVAAALVATVTTAAILLWLL